MEMVASSARPMVIRSSVIGYSAPGVGPASITMRLGRSSRVAARALGAEGTVCFTSVTGAAATSSSASSWPDVWSFSRVWRMDS